MSTPTKTNVRFGDATFTVYMGSRLYKLCLELKQEFPDLRMGHKRKMLRHWIAHVLVCVFTLFLNRRYLSDYTTTSKDRVDWSDKYWTILHFGTPEEQDYVWICLMHEREHLRQFVARGTFGMVLLWLFPPVLFCYGRAILIERPGYLRSLQGMFEVNRTYACSEDYRSWWMSQFTGAAYGWAWVLEYQVARWFDDELKRLQELNHGS